MDPTQAISLEQLTELMSAVPVGVVVTDPERPGSPVVGANAELYAITGYAPEELADRPMLDLAEPEDPGALRCCDQVHSIGRCDDIEVAMRRRDGSPLAAVVSARVFAVGGVKRCLVSVQDVSSLKRRERELTAARDQAERTAQARQRFLAAASHDLRQPLQALALFATALDRHVAAPQGRTILQSMKVSLRGMEEMFDSLLDMSRLDAGVMRAEPQVFLVSDILESLEADYGPQAEAAGLDLTFVPSSATVRSDPGLLKRIVGNFISNAVRYTRRGRILVGCRHGRTNLRIVVCDTGPGIPENKRLEIFREFHQVDAGESRGGGLGLGLAIVQRLARLLNHTVQIHSVEGRGSAFSVEVPLAEEWQAPKAEEEEEEEEEEDVREVDGATVVVVDDDANIREGLSMLLSAWGCRPVVAASAEQAMAELDRDGLAPQVVLADLHLEPGDRDGGTTAIGRIRDRFGAGIPAFLFTGDTAPPAAAGYPILRKPVNPIHLRSLLADALGR